MKKSADAGVRVIVRWLINSIAILLLGRLIPGVHVNGVLRAVAAAGVLGLLNALLWPLLMRLALRFLVLTLGLATLVLNVLAVIIAADVTGILVDGFLQALALALGITVINMAATSLLAIEDDDFYYRNVIRRQVRRAGAATETTVPGVLFLEVDGLAHSVLQRALRDGNAPTMARWLRTGTHRLRRWECDWSSQTGACQAGLLHGNNEDMPAFRWWEKEHGAALVANHLRDAMEIERRHSDGRGLLAFDGASRANMLSGDAPHSLLTISTVLRRDRAGRLGEDYYAYFANPYNVVRTIMLVIADVVRELWSATQQRRRDVQPRVHRSLSYAFLRSFTTVIQRDLQVQAVLLDIYSGRPVVYTTFLGYDEVAHHSGIERTETLAVLRNIDREFARIEGALADAPRPYRLVVLADHGQTQGATFRQRYRETLEELVKRTTGAETAHVGRQGTEGPAFLDASLSEASGAKGPLAGVLKRISSGRRPETMALPEQRPSRYPTSGPRSAEQAPEVAVLASGCLGLVYFPREPGRLSRERLEALYPGLLDTLRQHPGIGFCLVRSETRGGMVIGREGVRYLDSDRVEGRDPLACFGENAAAKVRRTDAFPHCADIVVNSSYWPETEEVAAFEELVGSHGGMGGGQAFPFVLHPSDWQEPPDGIWGAEQMHVQLRRWLVDLGQSEHAPALHGVRRTDDGHPERKSSPCG
jgi:uncharacterized membrane protein YvlD (DUF360 family)